MRHAQGILVAVLASAVLLVHAPPRPGRAMHAHDLGQDHPHRQPMPGSAWPADWQAGSIMPGSLGTLVGPHGVVRIRATAAGTRYDVLDARGRAVALGLTMDQLQEGWPAPMGHDRPATPAHPRTGTASTEPADAWPLVPPAEPVGGPIMIVPDDGTP